MTSGYTTVLDAGMRTLPPVPFLLLFAMPIFILSFGHVAKARAWRNWKPFTLALWMGYLAYGPTVLFQYWTLWHGQSVAQDATAFAVAAGPLDVAVIQQTPDGLFIDTSQDFVVNGISLRYERRALRYFDFLLPQAELVPLPLHDHAQVRVTYLDDGVVRQLLRFEIATPDLDIIHD